MPTTEPLTTDELARLAELDAAATADPWYVLAADGLPGDGPDVIGIADDPDNPTFIFEDGDTLTADADLIAAARNALPRILRQLQDQAERLAAADRLYQRAMDAERARSTEVSAAHRRISELERTTSEAVDRALTLAKERQDLVDQLDTIRTTAATQERHRCRRAIAAQLQWLADDPDTYAVWTAGLTPVPTDTPGVLRALAETLRAANEVDEQQPTNTGQPAGSGSSSRAQEPEPVTLYGGQVLLAANGDGSVTLTPAAGEHLTGRPHRKLFARCWWCGATEQDPAWSGPCSGARSAQGARIVAASSNLQHLVGGTVTPVRLGPDTGYIRVDQAVATEDGAR